MFISQLDYDNNMKEINVVKSDDLSIMRATIELTGRELAHIISALADHAEHKFPIFNPDDEFDAKDMKEFIAIRTELEALKEKMISS